MNDYNELGQDEWVEVHVPSLMEFLRIQELAHKLPLDQQPSCKFRRPRSTLVRDAALTLASRMIKDGYYRIEELTALIEALGVTTEELR